VADRAHKPEPSPDQIPAEGGEVRRCLECRTPLSSYNPGPNCWQHTIGYPWRGPSAKPKVDR
jgi:hypothetical protein